VLIPLGELPRRVEEVQELITPETLVVVYCHHGVRSIHGTLMLHQAGISNAVSMAGGIEAWSTLIDPTVPRY
jgi:rhodanese-related sulfurtransferase